MKKSTLLKYLFLGYQSSMEAKEYDDVKTRLLNFEKGITGDVSFLAKSIHEQYPEFDIMHNAYMRNRVDKICSSVKTIKIILIISFVASILAAIIILAQAN